MGCTGSKAASSSTSNTATKEIKQVLDLQVVEPPIPSEQEVVEAKQAAVNTTNPSNSQPAEKVAMEFVETEVKAWDRSNVEKACFGAGCYWGTEKYFRHDFSRKHQHLGIIHQGNVGFMGPIYAPENPSYREVCSGETGHVEVYDLEYSGGAPYFEALVRFFFQFHDPTTANRQGNDKGTQYASVIYCYSDEQYEIAHRIKDELQTLLDEEKITCFKGKVVTTDIRKSTKFYPAHEEHQDYLMKNPNGYCNHRIRFQTWPTPSAST